jgi:Golgi to ER traffic protein 4
MSAAAARRRKQLAARQKEQDVVGSELKRILQEGSSSAEGLTEATAYEALQLAQSAVRRKVKDGAFADACELAYSTSLTLLQHGRVAVASQLLDLLLQVLVETHTEATDSWIDKLTELHRAHEASMASVPVGQEATRLQRLQREWLLNAVHWSSDMGSVRYGHNQLQELLGLQCWKLSQQMEHDKNTGEPKQEDSEEEEEARELECDAVQHMALAEKPEIILEWLKSLPAPTAEETAAGHSCPPATRDALLTRSVLIFCAVENLRDGNVLLQRYVAELESRDIQELAANYTKKDTGAAPSHAIFCNMLLRILEKDARTGPLFQWLLRSFRRELDQMYKPQAVVSYTTKIGKLYFHIQPPPNMLNMMENMMGGMMGGGGGGGINPAMMQAAMAQLQQGGMM